ncbi:hypothetical protein QTP86_025588 [Hemibagrus guttatus]|nr:hypothetical protein QTP86_025588 [Hemibagrus guttatus]
MVPMVVAVIPGLDRSGLIHESAVWELCLSCMGIVFEGCMGIVFEGCMGIVFEGLDTWLSSSLCPEAPTILCRIRARLPWHMDTRYNGVHVYDRQTLLELGNHAPANVHDELWKNLRNLGLLRRPGPESSASPDAGGQERSRQKQCTRKRKRGKRAGVRARLKTNPSRPSLLSILLSNVCSLDNKLDYIRLQQTTWREYRDCCVFVFTETWLSDRVPDATIQLDGLTTFRADRNAALCVEFVNVRRKFYLPREFTTVFIVGVYIPPSANAKEALKPGQKEPSLLFRTFECTDWDMFREAATNGDTTDLEEYMSSVTSYISKCIDDVTISKSITTCSNQKPWMTAKVCALMKSRDSAFILAGDKDAPRTPWAKLS